MMRIILAWYATYASLLASSKDDNKLIETMLIITIASALLALNMLNYNKSLCKYLTKNDKFKNDWRRTHHPWSPCYF